MLCSKGNQSEEGWETVSRSDTFGWRLKLPISKELSSKKTTLLKKAKYLDRFFLKEHIQVADKISISLVIKEYKGKTTVR